MTIQTNSSLSGMISHALAHAALAQLGEGVIIADEIGRIVFVNEAAEALHGARLLGTAPEEYTASYRLMTLDEKEYPVDQLPLVRVVTKGETVVDAGWKIARPDGKVMQVVGTARPVFDPDGRQIGAVLTMHDDAPRLQAESAIREHEARLAALNDHLPGGMVYQIVTDLDGSNRRFTYLSKQYEALSGVPAAAAMADAQVAYNVFHPDDLQRLAAEEEVSIANRQPLDTEARFNKTDGTIGWSRIISAPRLAPDGRLIWDGIQIDITEQKRAEQAREESRQRLDAILGNTQMAVFLTDDRQRCIFANAAAEKLTGYDYARMAGRTLYDLVYHTRPDGTRRPLKDCPIERALPTRAKVQGEELFVKPDGTFYPVAFTASPMLDEHGTPVGTVIEARDITDEREEAKARQQAEEAERLLAREVDHRAKNLLAVVQSLIKLTPFHDRDQYAAALEGRIQALARVQSLLSQNRWQGALLEELVKRELAAHIHNQPDRLQVSGPSLLVQAELLHPLSMALHELATNAAKYGALSVEGGLVATEWSLDGETLRIVWREIGGPLINEPGSLGFGSQLLRGAARQAGGSVTKEWCSDGLHCVLSFPARHVRETRREPQANEAGAAADLRHLIGKRVLIVEDEALIGIELERTLTQAGATVIGPIPDHRTALRIAGSERFDCALLDANLGGISSEDVCRTIEQRGLPFLLLTGYERPGFPEHWPMLRKPARDQEVTAALCAVLNDAWKQGPGAAAMAEVRQA